MEQPLISIALCTYNGEKYLAEQIESILNQTYQNLELIIVDDRSTDGTFALVEEYAAKDARVKYFQNETNLGFNKNFEKALSLTTGDFIAISDQDDIWEQQKMQVLFDNIGNNWLVFSNSVFMKADGTVTDRILLKKFSTNHSYKSLLLNNYITGHNTLFRREFLDQVLPFPADGFYDWWMGFIALYHGRLVYVDQVLTRYREHGQAVTNIDNFTKQQRGNRFFKMMLNQLKTFITYKHYKPADRDYINKLNNAFNIKLTGYSSPLFKIVLKDYDDLFPFVKARKGISKLNFAFRFSKQQKGYTV